MCIICYRRWRGATEENMPRMNVCKRIGRKCSPNTSASRSSAAWWPRCGQSDGLMCDDATRPSSDVARYTMVINQRLQRLLIAVLLLLAPATSTTSLIFNSLQPVRRQHSLRVEPYGVGGIFYICCVSENVTTLSCCNSVVL